MTNPVLADPEFHSLPIEEKRVILERVDPEFKKLSNEEQLKVVLRVSESDLTGPAKMGQQGPFQIRGRPSPTGTSLRPAQTGTQLNVEAPRAEIPPEGLAGLARVAERPAARLMDSAPSAGARESRALLMSVGEALGARVGARAGPPGMAVGATLGAMGGAALAEPLQVDPSSTTGEMLGRIGSEGAFAAGGALTGVALESLKGAALRRIANLNQESLLLQQRLGLPASVETTTNRMSLRRTRNVLGRFPLLAGPFREADVARARRATQIPSELVADVAPVGPVSNLSERAVRRSRALWNRFRVEANRRYREVERLAENTPHQIQPTFSTIAAAEGRSELRAVAAESLRDSSVIGILDDIIGVGDEGLTFKQYRATAKALSSKARELGRQGKDQQAGILMKVRAEMDKDLLNIRSESDELVQATLDANKFFTENMRLFESQTAGKFMQADRSIFDLGFSANPAKNADQMLPVIFQQDSPQAMRDLRGLVGDRIFRQAAANHLENTFNAAIDVVDEGADAGRMRLNTSLLERSLGLFNRNSPKRKALQEMLSTTNIEVRDVERMVRGLEQMADSKFVNVSDFVSRRAVLGGFKSGLRAFTPGTETSVQSTGDLAKFVLGGVTFLMAGRKSAKFLADPKFVRLVNASMSDRLPRVAKQQALFRLGRLIGDEVDEQASLIQSGPTAAVGGTVAPPAIGTAATLGRGGVRPTPSVAGGLGALMQLLSNRKSEFQETPSRTR